MLNNRVVTVLTLNNLFKNIIIVQKNKIKHLINKLYIKRFAQNTGQNIVIFPLKHSYTKKNGGKSLLYKDLFLIQDGKYGAIAIGPGLLYYYKKMLVIVLSNIYTLLKIVNGASAIAYNIVIYLHDMHFIPNS